VTGTGKLLRRKAMKAHLLSKKSAKRKRSFAQDHSVHPADAREVKRLLGGGK
jgi:large subunit ribosomal protein L35